MVDQSIMFISNLQAYYFHAYNELDKRVLSYTSNNHAGIISKFLGLLQSILSPFDTITSSNVTVETTEKMFTIMEDTEFHTSLRMCEKVAFILTQPRALGYEKWLTAESGSIVFTLRK